MRPLRHCRAAVSCCEGNSIQLRCVMNDHSAAWANGALVGDSVEALRNIENVFTVGLIATPREAFRTCQADEQLARVVERYRSELFDFLPVIEASDDQIIGLI